MQPDHSVEGLRQFLKRSNTRGCEWDHDSTPKTTISEAHRKAGLTKASFMSAFKR